MAGLISTRFGVSFANTSDTIYETIAEREGVSLDLVHSMPKEALRPRLIEVGDKLCDEHGLAYLALTQLAKHDVVCGIRKPKELALVRSEYSDCLFIWVIRPDQKLIKDSTQLSHKDADLVIVNSGSLADLESQVTSGIVNASLGIKHPGNSLWNTLHWFAFQQGWSQQEQANFMQAFSTMLFITSRTCPCAIDFEAIKKVLPPPTTRDEFWNWTLLVHDWVNHKRGVPLHWDWTQNHPGFKVLREAFASRTSEGILAGTAIPLTQQTDIKYCSPCSK